MKKIGSLALASLLLGTLPAGARQLPNIDAYHEAAPMSRTTTVRSTKSGATATGVTVASVDSQRGTPTFVWGSGERLPAAFAAMPAEIRARAFLHRHAALWRLPDATVAAARANVTRSYGPGATLVTFRQSVDGVPVLGEELKVLTDGSGRLVAMTGSLHPAATATGLGKFGAWRTGVEDAVAAAIVDHTGVAVAARDLVQVASPSAAWTRWDLADPLALGWSLSQVSARRVLYALPDRLVSAWQVEVMATDQGAADARGYVFAATDGALLSRRGLTFNDAFNYRVWADPATKNPLDGPTGDFTPHPTGLPDGSAPPFFAPVLISMEGFNKNPSGVADPWLKAGATETKGNNVDAYQDHDSPDGLSSGEYRATTTSAGSFDRIYDTSLDPMASEDQVKAAVTQIFYTTNWLHDWWYDSGFNEVAGVAQEENYGRGGMDGDPLKAEAQDAANQGQRNNANMSAGSDGNSPRMQMYLWDGVDAKKLEIQPLGQSFGSGTAQFGPENFNLSGTLALVNDGAGTSPTDACEAITNNVSGKIAVLDRGTCTFISKVQKAETAGAIAVILINNAAGAAPGLSGTGTVGIPTLSVSKADGDKIKAALMNGPLTATMSRAAGTDRDGTIDNQIVAHEWGHYIHGRLVNCGSNQCGGHGEGWGDFMALHMTVEQGDNYHGVFAMAGYSTATLGDSFYFGIRRVPYSVDFSKNALTFRHISNGEMLPSHPLGSIGGAQNSEVHNAGEIWASMMFEAYVALLDETVGPSPRYGFAEARRRMSNYVVAGMQLAPASPTYTEQRDGVLAAAAAADLKDFVILAKAFARRGAGTGAVSPPRNSQDLKGVVESFVVKGDLALTAAGVADGKTNCDDDGVLDPGEEGTVVVKVQNPGVEVLTGTTVKVSSSSAGVTFPAGDTVTLGDLEPFAVLEAKVPVALGQGAQASAIELNVTASNAAAATASVTDTVSVKVNYDNKLEASATDDVESDVEVWTETALVSTSDVWSRATADDGSHGYLGVDVGEVSDVAYASPDLLVGDQPLSITLRHRFSFERSAGGPGGGGALTNWDGAVIEITKDGGTTWDDVSKYTNPGYGGTIDSQGDNPLGGRMGLIGQNAAYPNLDTLKLDFGTAFANQTVRVRFRIGTDEAQGDEGWYIDDIAVAGITNTPFPQSAPDGAICGGEPKADAGPDRSGNPGSTLQLDGRGSTDSNGDPLTYQWTQVDGPPATIGSATAALATVTVPDVPVGTQLTFQLAVSDGISASTDQMVITVTEGPPPGSDGDGDGEGGCGCRVGAANDGSGPALPLILALGAMVLPAIRRRRRAGRPA
jgi:hypothetical protein